MAARGRILRQAARAAAFCVLSALARAGNAQGEARGDGPDAGASAEPAAPAGVTEIVAPVLLSAPIAAWPPGIARASERVVRLVLTIDAAGGVEDARVAESRADATAVSSEDPEERAALDAAAVAAARGFRFSPARDARGPRRARILTEVRFLGTAEPAPLDAGGAAVRTTPEARRPLEGSLPARSPVGPAPAPNGGLPAPAEAHVRVWGDAPPRSASEVVLGQRTLGAAPHRNASELLMVVPGVFVSQHSGEGKAHQIFFRGFDAVHGQDMEVWAAGAPVNEISNVHGQGYADLHFLIPELVTSIQSQPGVYDPRQGDFAVAGTLRLSLGQSQPGLITKAGFGSFGRRRLLLSYRPAAAPAATFAAFELESTDGFGPARAARHGSAMMQVERELGPLTARLFASTYAGRFDSAGVLRLGDIQSGGVDRLDTYDGKQGGASSRTQLVLELSDEAPATGAALEPPAERWGLSPYLVLRALRLRSNFTGYLTSPEGDSTQQINEALTLGARAWYRRALGLFSARDGLEAGVLLRSDTIRQSQHRLSLLDDRVTDDELAPGIDARVRATDAAGYVDLALHPLPRLSLRGGLRADALAFSTEEAGGGAAGQARSALGAQLSKRATAELVLRPGLHALASYGEGFRSPQARSLADGETTPFTRVVSAEAGLTERLDAGLNASLAAFYTRLSDDLVFDPATLAAERVPATRRLGASLSVTAEPAPELVASGSLTYSRATFSGTDGRYGRGALVPYAPELVARADAAFTPVLGELGRFGALRAHVGVGGTYLGRRPLPYGELGHDALLLDARLGLGLGPLETALDVYNVLGAAWYDGEFVYASDFGGAPSLVPERHVTVGAPRSFIWYLILSV